jgi:hypothetical protein
VVDVYVNYLRKKLGAAATGFGRAETVIETVRGEGYMLGIGMGKKQVERVGGVFGIGVQVHA